MTKEIKPIKKIFDEETTLKKGTLFLHWTIAFFCGVIFAYMIYLFALVG